MSSRLIVIAATNYAEDLDPALIRSGRLNRVITMHRPSVDGIRDILRHHLGSDDLPSVDLTGVATLGSGATGAEVAAWVKAARRTARVSLRPLELADLVSQVAPPDDRSSEELLACARHEIGHACAVSSLSVGEVVSVTTVQSGGTAGLTRTRLARPRRLAPAPRGQRTGRRAPALGCRAQKVRGGRPGPALRGRPKVRRDTQNCH